MKKLTVVGTVISLSVCVSVFAGRDRRKKKEGQKSTSSVMTSAPAPKSPPAQSPIQSASQSSVSSNKNSLGVILPSSSVTSKSFAAALQEPSPEFLKTQQLSKTDPKLLENLIFQTNKNKKDIEENKKRMDEIQKNQIQILQNQEIVNNELKQLAGLLVGLNEDIEKVMKLVSEYQKENQKKVGEEIEEGASAPFGKFSNIDWGLNILSKENSKE